MGNRTEKEMEPRIPFTRVQADSGIGLSAAQVQERFAAHADNYKVESSTMSVSDIVKSNVFTYFNLIFAIIAVLLSIVAAWSDMMFLPIIIANTCIGIIQEVHSKKVLDRLSILNAPHCTVVRDGQEHEVEAHKLVLDDVVVLQAGSQIPADATVLDGELQVNESLITGESDEIAKHAGDELLSGSFVVSGKAHARLEKVGKDSYISKLTLQATQSKKGEQSEMIRSLNYLIMVMGIIIIPIGIALFVQSYIFNEGTLKESITGMVAAIIGMIPEGLYLLSSVAMAVPWLRSSTAAISLSPRPISPTVCNPSSAAGPMPAMGSMPCSTSGMCCLACPCSSWPVCLARCISSTMWPTMCCASAAAVRCLAMLVLSSSCFSRTSCAHF